MMAASPNVVGALAHLWREKSPNGEGLGSIGARVSPLAGHAAPGND